MAQLPFGQFNVEPVRKIGGGGLGIVDEVIVNASNCVGVDVGARFARKRLNDKFRANAEAQARFEREIEAVQRMSHSTIVPFRGISLPGNERFYLMPLYKQNLRERMAGSKGWPWTDVARIGAILADAMAYAHGLTFRHRDLKPENVLIDHSDSVIIADWGLGYFVHLHSTVMTALTHGGMGTAYYCSWEQWMTGRCDDSGDVYSLGMMLAEMVEGRQQPMSLVEVGNGLSRLVQTDGSVGGRMFATLLAKMTLRLPAQRPQSMHAVATELRRCLAFASYAA